jgi:hypothetical protein
MADAGPRRRFGNAASGPRSIGFRFRTRQTRSRCSISGPRRGPRNSWLVGSRSARHAAARLVLLPPTLLDCLLERASRRRRSRERPFCSAAGARSGLPRTAALPDCLQRGSTHADARIWRVGRLGLGKPCALRMTCCRPARPQVLMYEGRSFGGLQHGRLVRRVSLRSGRPGCCGRWPPDRARSPAVRRNLAVGLPENVAPELPRRR